MTVCNADLCVSCTWYPIFKDCLVYLSTCTCSAKLLSVGGNPGQVQKFFVQTDNVIFNIELSECLLAPDTEFQSAYYCHKPVGIPVLLTLKVVPDEVTIH
jgi:hypothetical protein